MIEQFFSYSYLPQIADKLQLLSMRLYQVHMTMGGNKMHNLNTINDGPFYQADALLHD
jgi:hypothetical protein